jgi:hypothetical protein
MMPLTRERPMPPLLRLSAVLFVLATACHSGSPGTTVPADQTRVRIENRNSVDMDIYVRRSEGRVSRLGFAPADQTVTFALPAAITAGTPWIQLEARPARGAGELAVSEQFPVKQGDEITWSVPAQ